MNAATIKPGTEVKILQVSNPQHRKRIGKTGRVSNEKSNYHGHKNKVPVQIGRDICWIKPEHLESVQKVEQADINSAVDVPGEFKPNDTVYLSKQGLEVAPEVFKNWARGNKMVVQAIHQNLEGRIYLNLIIKDLPDQCLPADPSWVVRQLTISEATPSNASGVDADEGVRECADREGLNVAVVDGPKSDTGDTGSVLIEEDEPVKISQVTETNDHEEPVKISQVTETNGHEEPVKFPQLALDISIGEPDGNSQLIDDGTEPVKFSQVIEVDAGTEPVKFSQVTLWLHPDDIIVCQNTQPRRGESRERIDEYAELMSEGLWEFERHPLPKVMLIDGTYYAVDVHHRQAAAAKAGKQLLCKVLMGTLPEARILAASFNTDHGVPYAAGDQRRRIEQVLDNLALISDKEKAELFAKHFCVKGNKQGGQIEIDCRSYDAGWSSRNIARYLHLPESGYRTVCNIIKERDFAAELKRWGIEQDSWENRERVSGTRIEIIHHPDSTYIGETGQVWNASLSQQTLGISLDCPVNASSHIRVELDWIKKTDKPKPEKAEVNALTSAGYSSNSSNGYSSTESLGAASNSQVSAGGIPIVKSIAQENKEAQQRLGLGNPFQTEHGEDPQRCEGAVDRPSPAIEKFNSGKTLVMENLDAASDEDLKLLIKQCQELLGQRHRSNYSVA